uniref:Uncharacterized protein n=1 Tax=Schistocephalus solidus TaxID=70667 RepID=A0A0V0J4T2_SCHSO
MQDNHSISQTCVEKDGLAKYLLKENLLLTALEYHYELLERGIMVECLKDFFENPSNFDTCENFQPPEPSLKSCVSISTLDSMDLHADNDDNSAIHNQVKVLEFELRKKNEEIRNLRDLLTTATIGASGATQPPNKDKTEQTSAPVMPLEKRTIRFLINEHLLSSGYKLTAVQFAEECEVDEQQDLDDWTDVGLNCNRPPDLVSLLRRNWKSPQNHSRDSSVTARNPFDEECQSRSLSRQLKEDIDVPSIALQTDTIVMNLKQELEVAQRNLSIMQCSQSAMKAELEVSHQQLDELRGKIGRLEAENLSLSQESTYWRNQLLCLKRDFPDLVTVTSKVAKTSQQHSSVANLLRPDCDAASSHSAGISSDNEACAPPNSSNPDSEAAVERTEISDVTENQAAEPDPLPVPSLLPKPVEPPSSRKVPAEFLRCATQLLPSRDSSPDEADDLVNTSFRLADSLDEIIVILGRQIEGILAALTENSKAIALPLLVQAICLHPDPAARDRLLRCLFNLFAAVETADDGTKLEHGVIILRQCWELATCLGPQRIESELLPQIWSQLNERPSRALRKLLVSACGVIAPATPSRLRSSLLLSILSQAIEEEKAEPVRAAAIRSLACAVTLMEDPDKLGQLASALERILKQHQPNENTFVGLADFRLQSASGNVSTSLGSWKTVDGVLAEQKGFEVTCNWLLPTVAQWCLEEDRLNDLLVEPWLERLDSLGLQLVENTRTNASSATRRALTPRSEFPTVELQVIQAVLERLVPFIFAQFLQSMELVLPALRLSSPEVPVSSLDGEMENHGSTLFDPRSILGVKQHCQLIKALDWILKPRQRDEGVVLSTGDKQEDEDTRGGEDENCSFDEDCADGFLQLYEDGDWPAMDFVKSRLLLHLAQVLKSIQPIPQGSRDIPIYLEPDATTTAEFVTVMQSQLDENFFLPWRLHPSAPELIFGRVVCRLIWQIGRIFGPSLIQSHLYEPFQTLLMEKTLQGYFEYNVKALPTGLLAGYCCLLASANTKSEINRVKMLLTNAIFLHTQDSCSLHGVRFAIMCLCHTNDPWEVAREIVLPALRSCASSADPSVRRTASTIFNCLIGCLTIKEASTCAGTSSKQPVSASTNHNQTVATSTTSPPAHLLNECWQLASQLVRDDYAAIGTAATIFPEEEAQIDSESADWACIAYALGPLFCFYSRLLRPSVHVTDADLKRLNLSENYRLSEKVLLLLARLMDMVNADFSASALETTQNHVQLQRPHWETLVTGLLQVLNKLFPTCSDDFRDDKILPWLYRLTEVNNRSPDSEQRGRLVQRLIAVFSTAAFCLGTEPAMVTWVMPGLDRLRLDLIETGDKDAAEELEQLSADLRQRLLSQTTPQHPAGRPPTTSTENKPASGLRGKLSNLLESTTHSTPSSSTVTGPAGGSSTTASASRKVFAFAKRS